VTSAPIAVEAIAGARSVEVVKQRFPDGDVSGMLLREPEHVVIGVNSAHGVGRQRFTIAHELGHLELHRGRRLILDVPVRVDYRDRTSSLATDREEIEANRFAAALLMPEAMVISAAREADARVLEDLVPLLAKRFQVSIEAMSYRLINLGLIS
jgi:Zn-dependent peptidase ImmA (M78 family)